MAKVCIASIIALRSWVRNFGFDGVISESPGVILVIKFRGEVDRDAITAWNQQFALYIRTDIITGAKRKLVI